MVDFFFSGVALLIVNGLSNLTAAALLLARKKAGILLGGIFGVTLMLWICIQFYMFPLNFMSTIYFIFGLIQASTGFATYIFFKQETFAQMEKEHLQGQNTDIYEVKSTERTEGTLGFWCCGRFGMHRCEASAHRPPAR